MDFLETRLDAFAECLDRGSSILAGEPQVTAQDRMAEAIEQAAIARLQQSPYFEMRRVTCHCVAGVLTLSGELPSFFHKQVAQSLMQELAGVTRLENRTRVASLPAENVWRDE